MKTWFLKFLVSNSLNDRRPLPPTLERVVSQSPSAQRFREESQTLDQRLKNQSPIPEAPAFLHTSIMRSVSASAKVPATQNRFSIFHVVRYVCLASLVLLAVFVSVRVFTHALAKEKSSEPPAFAAADSALELGGNILSEAPSAAISPLYDEAAHLDHDMASTKQFLLASLP
ncbi:MAG TPA: hypothetical protein VH413_12360 [Verrucomicrobiae bacterium]|jgi:hypothetical protein|nr:hypothetical protein [Verrucomicrobiae bacterium]